MLEPAVSEVSVETALSAVVRIEFERGLRRLEIGDGKVVGGGERLQQIGLVAQRQLVAGLVAELQAEVGILAAARLSGELGELVLRPRHAGEHRRAEGEGGDRRGSHGLHTALSSDVNIASTVVNSLAVVVYEFSTLSMLVISVSRLTPVAFDSAVVAWLTTEF